MKQKFSENFCVFWVFFRLALTWLQIEWMESWHHSCSNTLYTLILQIMKVQDMWSIEMTKMV